MRSGAPTIHAVEAPPPVDEAEQQVRNRILQLRVTGASYTAIARNLGITPREAARHAAAALQDLQQLQSDENGLRQTLALQQLEVLQQQVYTVMQQAQPSEVNGKALPGDPTLLLQATDRLLRIQQRQDEVRAQSGRRSPTERSGLQAIRDQIA